MRKSIISFLLTLIITAAFNISNGQLIYYYWIPQQSPVSQNLNSLTSSSPYLVAVGNSGSIIYSANSDTNWFAGNSGVSVNLTGTTSTAYIFFASGPNGLILKSTNNGINWTQTTAPFSNNVNCISNFVAAQYKLACGDNGKLAYTINLGTNWSEISTGTNQSLRNIYYVTTTSLYRGYVCGDNGTFLKLILGVPPLPPTINLLSYNTGFSNNFNAVTALADTNNILMVGSGGIIVKSTNGGINWTQQTSTTVNILRCIHVVSASDIWVGGDNGTILHTTNGGASWHPQTVLSTANINSLLLIGPAKGIAVGSGGTILNCIFPLQSYDTTVRRIKLEGNNLSSYFQSTGINNQNTTSTTNTPGLEWPKGSNKYVCFSSGMSISALVNGNLRQAMCSYTGEYRLGTTANGTPSTPGSLMNIYSIKTGDNCYNSLFWANWGDIVPYGAPYYDVNHNGAYEPCIDTPGVRNASQTIFMALTDGYPNSHKPGEGFGGGTLPLYADLRITAWCYSDSVVRDVHFIKYDVINKGTSAWNNVYMALTGDVDIGSAEDDFINIDSTRNMWIGYNGDNNDPIYGINPPAMGMRILKFPVNKSVNPPDSVKSSSGIYFICTGCGPPPCESDPNGEPLAAYNMLKGFKKDLSPWMNPTFNPPVSTKFIYSGEPEPNTGWTELKGKVLNCGGPNGSIQPTNTPGDRRYVLSFGRDNFTMNPGDSQSVVIAQLVARGSSNTNSVTKLKELSDLLIPYLNTVDIKIISGEVPTDFALEQNYPNPFNPITTIQFQVPVCHSGVGRNPVVTIKVFDLLGREVKTLVNEYKQPGTYQVSFNADGLSSGVYFYTMKAGDFVATKKFVLLK